MAYSLYPLSTNLERIDESNNRPIRTNQDRLSVPAELQPRPVAVLLLVQLERDKGTSVEGAHVVQLNALGINARRKDQSIRIVGSHGSSTQIHHALTIRRAQVPQSQSLVQCSTEESVVQRTDAQRNDLIRVAGEVAQVLVVVQAEVADRVVNLR